jgi:hypothetical protein
MGRRAIAILVAFILWAEAQVIHYPKQGSESCKELKVATAETGPGRPRYNEMWVDEPNGRCSRQRLYTVTYATTLQGEGFCITAASAREHGFNLNIIGMQREKEFQRRWFMDRLLAMYHFVAKLPQDAIILHVSFVSWHCLHTPHAKSAPKVALKGAIIGK